MIIKIIYILNPEHANKNQDGCIKILPTFARASSQEINCA
jgi:hypothetical protein